MTHEDVPEIADLEMKYFSVPWSENSLDKEVDNESSVFITAECEGVAAGYAGMYLMGYEAGITNVVVNESYRHSGIGDGLIKKIISEGAKRGVTDITLEVRKSNREAVHLYRKNGFAEEGIRPGFYDNPKEDAIIMWNRNIFHYKLDEY